MTGFLIAMTPWWLILAGGAVSIYVANPNWLLDGYDA